MVNSQSLNVAFVIGCQHYQNFRDVQGTYLDARNIRKAMTDYCGCDSVDVFLITGEETDGRVACQPNRDEINAFLNSKAIAYRERSIDSLFFYFSGHGCIDAPGRENEQVCLLPENAFSATRNGNALILGDIINAMANQYKPKHMISFIDACLTPADSEGRTVDTDEEFVKSAVIGYLGRSYHPHPHCPEATTTLFACYPYERAYGDNAEGGAFTKRLIQAFAHNANHTLQDVYDYTQKLLEEANAHNPSQRQDVYMDTHGVPPKDIIILERRSRHKDVRVIRTWLKEMHLSAELLLKPLIEGITSVSDEVESNLAENIESLEKIQYTVGERNTIGLKEIVADVAERVDGTHKHHSLSLRGMGNTLCDHRMRLTTAGLSEHPEKTRRKTPLAKLCVLFGRLLDKLFPNRKNAQDKFEDERLNDAWKNLRVDVFHRVPTEFDSVALLDIAREDISRIQNCRKELETFLNPFYEAISEFHKGFIRALILLWNTETGNNQSEQHKEKLTSLWCEEYDIAVKCKSHTQRLCEHLDEILTALQKLSEFLDDHRVGQENQEHITPSRLRGKIDRVIICLSDNADRIEREFQDIIKFTSI